MFVSPCLSGILRTRKKVTACADIELLYKTLILLSIFETVSADAWMRGCVDARMRGCVDARMRGCVDARMRGCVDARMRGCVDALQDALRAYFYFMPAQPASERSERL
jgi:hypothetical protein